MFLFFLFFFKHMIQFLHNLISSTARNVSYTLVDSNTKWGKPQKGRLSIMRLESKFVHTPRLPDGEL